MTDEMNNEYRLGDEELLVVKSYLSSDGKHRVMDCPFCDEKFIRPVVGTVTPGLVDAMREMQNRFREHLSTHYAEEGE